MQYRVDQRQECVCHAYCACGVTGVREGWRDRQLQRTIEVGVVDIVSSHCRRTEVLSGLQVAPHGRVRCRGAHRRCVRGQCLRC